MNDQIKTTEIEKELSYGRSFPDLGFSLMFNVTDIKKFNTSIKIIKEIILSILDDIPIIMQSKSVFLKRHTK